MNDIHIHTQGHAGRITLDRPQALNAITYEMCLEIELALINWLSDDNIKLVIIDATGDKAFCAGGDIQDLYKAGCAGDFDYGQTFWRDEYRLNALIAEYPKPYVAFMQGFTMGGGVGISCHGSHRIVCENSQIAMPEVSIGLVPDVGGSLLLARAPGRLGEYLGTTAARMQADCAIFAGFADTYIPRAQWSDLIETLCETGNAAVLEQHSKPAISGPLREQIPQINRLFGGEALRDIKNALVAKNSEFSNETLKQMARNSPLAMASAVELIHRVRGPNANIYHALEMEYRFTFRAQEKGDFLEGVRAAVIDKDRSPEWLHSFDNPPALEVSQMLMPLGENALTFEQKDATS
ncbi:enoyl-CoA hydratase/isomerase family protein [Roseovarius sp. EL26]|uniref:enoyl-CoA hydratase/isomerase family protein n=1 Tax=Roseovarius sp. EL26 TaxID=2126672 RepID=UPI000EA3C2A8|nr:enoyl-CoA hydratase/isomerase family protein [Roseovarius sp. EL26]